MNELDDVLVQSSCRQLLGLYLTSVDAKNLDSMLEAFMPDAEWVRPSMPPMRGHGEIRAFFESLWTKQRRASPHGHLTRHLLTTTSIVAVDANQAQGIAYALVFRAAGFDGKLPVAMPEPELLVEYRDGFLRTEGGWRIARHEAVHVFKSSDWVPSLSPQEVRQLNLAAAPPEG